MNETTLRHSSATPSLRQRLAARLLLAHLRRIRVGRLDVGLPDDGYVRFGDDGSQLRAALRIKSWRFFKRALLGADIGLGESYMDDEWECDDIGALLSIFIANQQYLSVGGRAVRIGNRLRTWMHANTRRGSRRNIAYHYDLGNELYRLFLDPTTMTYSCGVFARSDASLDEAQVEKLDGISRRLELARGMEVLEIGSGWGGFAIHAASRYGSRVTSITLSERQLELARERAQAAKVDALVDFRLCDYRDMAGAFDRIVSIEMFEAVGYEYYRAFFEACDRLLRPGGRMLLQTITVPDDRFEAYRRSYDFIRKYIFPGGLLASVDAIQRTLQAHTQLQIEWMRNIGPHYAPTLRSWRDRFMRQLPEVRRLGYGDRFIRMWEFYLACCETQFAAGTIGDVQIVLAKK
jgi:cyclopropane-fatty-acyl-phospholipid synthase